MPTVEYLLIVQKAGTFCDSVDAFNKLLRVDSSITIEGGTIHHFGDFECGYLITSGEIEGKEQRFFHLQFAIDDTEQARLDRFTAFLKVIRSIMSRMGGQPETLWDDISFLYSRQGYDLIHRIENLMRKLIANFMLVTIGKEWLSETTPAEVKIAIDKSKRKDYLNVLHTIDFIHLADFLLKPYSTKATHEVVSDLANTFTIDDLNALKQFVPVSNWKRYFSSIVDCDDAYLKKRWEELYELRCKVAHNAIINRTDLDRITALVGELQVKLKDAITKLPQVKVPADEVRQLAENAASTISQMMGEFILAWRRFEEKLRRVAVTTGMQNRPIPIRQALQALQEHNLIQPDHVQRALKVNYIRNHLVHPTGVSVPEAELSRAISELHSLIRLLDDGQWEEPNLEMYGGDP